MRNRKIAASYGKKNVSILIYLMTFIFTLCLPPGAAFADLAGFQNGDFSNGFAGWSGNLIFTGNVDPASDSHFSITTQGAQIRNDGFDFMLTLYQNFQMGGLSPANGTINLKYWLQWSPTADEQEPSVAAFLYDYDPITQQISNSFDLLQNIPMSDLLQGIEVSCDVTSFANRSVRLAFIITDTDLNTPDLLSVGNISLSGQSSNPVPLPSALLLTISGLAGLCVFRRKREGVSTARKQA